MKRALCLVFVFSILVCLSLTAAARQGAAGGGRGGAQGGGRGGRGAAGRIVSFEANPTSIKPGESFVLSWSTESGTGAIDNGIGAVPTRGTIRVTPKATATYTLSIGAVTRSVTVAVAGTTPISAAEANQSAAPRTEARIDGKPNFSGVYGGVGGGGGGGARGARGGGTAAQTPASPYANLPAQPTLKPGVVNRAASAPNPSGGTADCMPLPADTAFGVPYPFQIVQSRDYLIFFFEYPGSFRIVPLDGQPHPADPDPTWMGDSIGKWDGDTLVIDTVGYNGKHAIGGIQQPSETFHTIERLTRTGATGMSYEIIYEDPEFATGQWRATPRTFNADTRPGVNRIMEFVCENNRDYTPLFGPEGPTPGRGRGN